MRKKKCAKNNPGTSAHRYFIGPTGNQENFANVSVTYILRDMIRNAR